MATADPVVFNMDLTLEVAVMGVGSKKHKITASEAPVTMVK